MAFAASIIGSQIAAFARGSRATNAKQGRAPPPPGGLDPAVLSHLRDPPRFGTRSKTCSPCCAFQRTNC
jgi:hypothetical protein